MKMKVISFLIIIIYSVLSSLSLRSQDVMTLGNALQIAFANNHQVLLVSKQLEIAQNNNTLGNAGFLPNLSIGSGWRESIQNVNQVFLDGRSVDRTGARADQFDAGINLNWTIFDGMKMFLIKEQFSEIERIGQLELKSIMEITAGNIISTYYNIVRIKSQLRYISESVQISRERFSLTKIREEVGRTSKFDVLQAQTDLNTDIADSISIAIEFLNSKMDLTLLMGLSKFEDFDVEDDIIIRDIIPIPDISSLESKNTNLQIAKQNKKIAEIERSIANSALLPQLNLYGNYNLSQAKSQSGFLIENSAIGGNYGLSISYSIFEGFNRRRNIENATTKIEMSAIDYNFLADNIISRLKKEFNTIELLKSKLGFDKENILVAEENMQLASERLSLGVITPIEFREIQNKLNQARTRLTETLYLLKLSETTILHITGSLIHN